MRRVIVLFFSAVILSMLPLPTSAQELAVVRERGAASERGPVQARVGEVVTLRVVVRARGGRTQALAPSARVRWFRVTPHMQHEDTPPPNQGVSQYSNSVLFGPRHGRWIGFDRVEYEMTPIAGNADRLVIDRVPSADPSVDAHGGAGSAWFAAHATLPDGRVLRSADATNVDGLGLEASVLRVSFRASDDYLGWLSTYFQVPDIFGSTGPQADRYIGADCADVLVGARRASGAGRVGYTSVGGIASVARPVSAVLLLGDDGVVRDEDGEAVVLRWDEDVEAGDLFAIDYTTSGAQLPRPWDHIGALLGDADGDGVLGAADGLRHMAPSGLTDDTLAAQGPIRFRVWRFRS